MTAREFRFGVVNGTVGEPGAWADTARTAESLGYSTFVLPDTTATPAPLPALAAAAAATTTLRVGTWVLCDPLRNPRQLAWEVGTVQQLSRDRFELGIGAGRPGAQADCDRLGVPFGTPSERIARLRDSLHVLREALPRTHLLIAASGPKLLALAAQTADTVAFGWPPTTDLAQARERIGIVGDVAGSRVDDIELAAGLIAVGADEQPWLTRAGLTAAGLAADGAVTVLTGSPAQMVDELQRRRDALGVSYFTVPMQAARHFAPVVETLTGH